MGGKKTARTAQQKVMNIGGNVLYNGEMNKPKTGGQSITFRLITVCFVDAFKGMRRNNFGIGKVMPSLKNVRDRISVIGIGLAYLSPVFIIKQLFPRYSTPAIWSN